MIGASSVPSGDEDKDGEAVKDAEDMAAGTETPPGWLRHIIEHLVCPVGRSSVAAMEATREASQGGEDDKDGEAEAVKGAEDMAASTGTPPD